MPDSTRPRRLRARSLAIAATSLAVAGLVITVPVLNRSDTSGSGAEASTPGQGAHSVSAAKDPARAGVTRPCKFRPTKSNTGARGELQDRGVTTLGSGATLENARVQSLEVVGSDVTIKNVHVDGTITVSGDRVRIRRTTAQGIFVSSGTKVSVKRSKVESSLDDAFHITSDRGTLVRNVRLRYNFVHRPVTPNENHYDGVQVRGVDKMSISCSTFRAGPYHDNFNAAIFLENANGGDSNVQVRDNWLFGFAFSVMVDSPSAVFTGNKIGGDIKWGPCLLLESAGSSFTSSGNTWAGSGKKVNFCGQG